ncbi:MLP protein 28 [Theobroma cacao]|uniref:MLP protein 28 n=1 Tax=Theobroma cacao TaxID=3641 RepID=A0A061E7N6_THECC|nr:MLP protein 28 [Theobroma cacao]
MSSLIGKVVADVEIRASAEKFYGVFCNTPSQLSSICPDVIQACHLLDGEWGRLGSITHWSYVHDGQAKVAKLIIESVDSTKNSITYGVIGGDLKNEFNSFTFKIEATQKDGGQSSTLDSWIHKAE